MAKRVILPRDNFIVKLILFAQHFLALGTRSMLLRAYDLFDRSSPMQTDGEQQLVQSPVLICYCQRSLEDFGFLALVVAASS
ncbi:hypothetical protein ZHAS_00021653 [Anopheles sinensis]|uniref:Uncharacterized protein n=1 Tax=Anopheles sinensis TaxID=74873 RepID=A0A084WT01_ANOSI|nr:hypothetical protein ZHAS_00021653 [Anopheles sinensis]